MKNIMKQMKGGWFKCDIDLSDGSYIKDIKRNLRLISTPDSGNDNLPEYIGKPVTYLVEYINCTCKFTVISYSFMKRTPAIKKARKFLPFL